VTQYVGILTAGGDSPGLNAAIRGVGKAAIGAYGMQIIGFRDGFRGLMQDRTMRLTGAEMSGILTVGGTILGTSRDKPHKMPVGDQTMDMTSVMLETYHKHHLDALVCLGGGGTQKNAYHLSQNGMNVITLPKTIDNDVSGTDMTFGFDTALGIATEAIDRLHSTAHSHHRIIVVELMGHNAGWLALGAGIAGGADVILIPELPYDVEVVAEAIRQRQRRGSGFSIVAVSEGAMTERTPRRWPKAAADGRRPKRKRMIRKRSAPRPSWSKLTLTMQDKTLRLIAAAGGTDRAGVARDDPGPLAAGRHALRGRPAAGDAAGHGLRRPDPPGRLRRDGGGAWRRRRSRAPGRCGGQGEARAARSSVDQDGARHWRLPGRSVAVAKTAIDRG
jgi:6-phosphofructokinase